MKNIKTLALLIGLLFTLTLSAQYPVVTSLNDTDTTWIWQNGATKIVEMETISDYAEENNTMLQDTFGMVIVDSYSDANTAIAAIPSTGGTLFFGEGTYNISSTLTVSADNVTIQGSGNGKTLIYLSNGANASVITIGGDNWTIKDLEINGNGDNNTGSNITAIYGASRDNITISNCVLHDAEDYIIRIHSTSDNWLIKDCKLYDSRGIIIGTAFGTGSTNVKILRCDISGSTASSQVEAQADAKYFHSDWTIDDCKFTGGTGYMGVLFDSCVNSNVLNSYFDIGEAAGVNAPANIRYYAGASGNIMGNKFMGAGIGSAEEFTNLSLYGAHHVNVIGNFFTHSGIKEGTGIQIESQVNGVPVEDIVISNNTFYNITAATSGKAAIQLYSASAHTIQRINISDNVFMDDRGASSWCYYGVYLPSTSAGTIEDVNITGNTFEGMLQYGVFDAAPSSNIVINNNIFNDIPDGVECDDGDQIMITNNRFDACTIPIDVNDADVIRPMIHGNNWDGCTNDASTASATNPRIRDNVDKDGAWETDN